MYLLRTIIYLNFIRVVTDVFMCTERKKRYKQEVYKNTDLLHTSFVSAQQSAVVFGVSSRFYLGVVGVWCVFDVGLRFRCVRPGFGFWGNDFGFWGKGVFWWANGLRLCWQVDHWDDLAGVFVIAIFQKIPFAQADPGVASGLGIALVIEDGEIQCWFFHVIDWIGFFGLSGEFVKFPARIVVWSNWDGVYFFASGAEDFDPGEFLLGFDDGSYFHLRRLCNFSFSFFAFE